MLKKDFLVLRVTKFFFLFIVADSSRLYFRLSLFDTCVLTRFYLLKLIFFSLNFLFTPFTFC